MNPTEIRHSLSVAAIALFVAASLVALQVVNLGQADGEPASVVERLQAPDTPIEASTRRTK